MHGYAFGRLDQQHNPQLFTCFSRLLKVISFNIQLSFLFFIVHIMYIIFIIVLATLLFLSIISFIINFFPSCLSFSMHVIVIV